MFQEIKSKRIEGVIREIKDQYFAKDNYIPWIIGFSGGKDSTALLTLVWIALKRLKEDFPLNPNVLQRPVYVVTNDTMVENPIISNYVGEVLSKIESAARDQGLPIFIERTTPKLEESFWTNIIGKGYPVPNSTFRWCTDKLKIRPTSYYLSKITEEKGEAIVLIGTRYQESSTRERSIKKHEVIGRRLSKHTVSTNAYVFAPIKSLMIEEIWFIINSPSPWGFDNNILFQIYAEASADDYECPTVVTDDKHKSCGQSRFGCWTCTVVKRDKSMSSLVNNGNEWMRPLMEFRDKLSDERNISENRMSTRRNGANAVDEEGHNFGNYSPKYRAQILEELLHLQKEIQKDRPHINLISNQELIAIQVIWNREKELIWEYKVADIYKKVNNKSFSTSNINSLGQLERRILRDVCGDDNNYYQLIENLISLQESKTLMITKYGVHNDVERRIESFISDIQ